MNIPAYAIHDRKELEIELQRQLMQTMTNIGLMEEEDLLGLIDATEGALKRVQQP